MKEVVDDVVLKKNSELLLKKLQLLDYQNYFLYCNGDTVRNRADTLIKLNGVKVTYGIETEFTEKRHSIHLGMVKITFWNCIRKERK